MIDTSDVDRFAAKLNTSPSPAVEALWMNEWSEKIADEMRNRVPVQTGTLRNSITTTADGVIVGADYGVYVEYGTGDTSPQPFAGPALDRMTRPSVEDLGDRVILELT
jgi:HK97 gp10 family phage protein